MAHISDKQCPPPFVVAQAWNPKAIPAAVHIYAKAEKTHTVAAEANRSSMLPPQAALTAQFKRNNPEFFIALNRAAEHLPHLAHSRAVVLLALIDEFTGGAMQRANSASGMTINQRAEYAAKTYAVLIRPAEQSNLRSVARACGMLESASRVDDTLNAMIAKGLVDKGPDVVAEQTRINAGAIIASLQKPAHQPVIPPFAMNF